MLKLVKYRETIYQNFPEKDGEGNYTIADFSNPETAKDAIVETLNYLTDRYFYEIAAERGDYKNMGEIYVDASQNDPDAQYLLKLYEAVWNAEEEAENEVNGINDQKKLLEILRDVPAYLMPKLESAKSQLDSSNSSNASADSTSSASTGA